MPLSLCKNGLRLCWEYVCLIPATREKLALKGYEWYFLLLLFQHFVFDILACSFQTDKYPDHRKGQQMGRHQRWLASVAKLQEVCSACFWYSAERFSSVSSCRGYHSLANNGVEAPSLYPQIWQKNCNTLLPPSRCWPCS